MAVCGGEMRRRIDAHLAEPADTSTVGLARAKTTC
jgi:hypothetical protein